MFFGLIVSAHSLRCYNIGYSLASEQLSDGHDGLEWVPCREVGRGVLPPWGRGRVGRGYAEECWGGVIIITFVLAGFLSRRVAVGCPTEASP